MSHLYWSRREWLSHHSALSAVLVARPFGSSFWFARPTETTRATHRGENLLTRGIPSTTCLEPEPLEKLVLCAIDAARTAGARYADARFTRTVVHMYSMASSLEADWEEVGLGVRTLVDGYWGFAASPYWTSEDAGRLAQDAVAQSKANAKGPTRRVELGVSAAVTGRWATPIRIDPFTIPIEEKFDYFTYWRACAEQAGAKWTLDGWPSKIFFVRQERVVATSDGSLYTQTIYKSGAEFTDCTVGGTSLQLRSGAAIQVKDINMAGAGWERLLDAKLPEQFPARVAEARARAALGAKPSTVGRYTLVCDGVTMAALLDKTLGIATQLDRASGYEANANGTSFITDPLAMVGQLQVAAPLVTVTANRSVPAQLATVRWDDEGVVPEEITLVKNGVLTDFQTTREQAAWLAPYYQRHGRPVRSNGCAAAEDALAITMQHMPNLALAPSPSTIRLEDLVADVKAGILIEGGQLDQIDFQARHGLLIAGPGGRMREITNGRLGRVVNGGAVQFDSLDLWKNVIAVGGTPTQQDIGLFKYNDVWQGWCEDPDYKGQPVQTTDHSVQAVAATITNQAVIDPSRKV